MKKHTVLLAGALLVLATGRLEAQPSLMEDLGRGIVAVRSTATEIFVSWRVLGTDPPDIAFNLYRSTAGADPVRLNATPISAIAGLDLTPFCPGAHRMRAGASTARTH